VLNADQAQRTQPTSRKASQSDQASISTRLLSDNGPAYVSKDLRAYLKERGFEHTRGRPYHPQTQGKIERYHRSMKNVVKLEHYYFPWELRAAIDDFVSYYNHRRYHESLDNCTPADVYYGQHQQVLSERSKIKKLTMEKRKKAYRDQYAAYPKTINRLLLNTASCPKSSDDLHNKQQQQPDPG